MLEMVQKHDWPLALNNLSFKIDNVASSNNVLCEQLNKNHEKIHNLAVKAFAQAYALLDIRLIHFSAFGLKIIAKNKLIQSKF